MQDSADQSQHGSSVEFQNTWTSFVQATQLTKNQLTYNLLVDLHTLKSANQQPHQPHAPFSVQTLNEVKHKLLALYVDKINAIDEYFMQNELKYLEQSIHKTQQQIISNQQFHNQIKTQQLFTLQKDLNQQLKLTLSTLRQFIQNVSTRIQHQTYLDNQRQIDAYIQRQTNIFDDQKGELERHIRKNNNDVKKNYIKIAREVCQQKQKEIQQLQTAKKKAEEQLHQAKKHIEELNQTQKQMYKQNSDLNEKILEIKAQQGGRLRQARKQTQPSQNGQSFIHNNVVSEILPSRSENNQQSTIWMAEIQEQSQKPPTKCEIASDDLKSELKSRKILIVVFVFISLFALVW